jgi:hypothetical protein
MDGTRAYYMSASDRMLDLGVVWREAEFNIVGNAGGSEAAFNKGTALTLKLAVRDGSTVKPGCASNAGTTGETNNLNLGSCLASGGAEPSIQFTESD